MNRIIAILHNDDLMTENVHNIIDIILNNDCTDSMFVFSKTEKNEFNIKNNSKTCQNIVWPAECDNNTKIRNWINSYFKSNNFLGTLHVLEDSTKILKNPFTFLNDIENMMNVLDYDVWFSTVCDACNFIYSKYNPRLSIVLDRAEMFKLNLGKQLFYTSHSNTQWVAYNFAKVPDDLLKFNEDFSIAMFYIIEFLARRRNTKKENQLYFMNQYLTVESEYGTFKHEDNSVKQDLQETIKTEDAKFKELNINFAPDNNIDIVLETTYKKIKEKL